MWPGGWKENTRGMILILFSFTVFSVGAFGVYRAMRSSLFLIREVVIEGESNDPRKSGPLDPATLQSLARVPVGKINLFELDLDEIEQRIRKHPWIRTVHLEKRLPGTLRILVRFRKPVAFVQKPLEELKYLDGDGTVFGPVDFKVETDLPLVNAAAFQNLKAVADFVLRWQTEEIGKISRLLVLDQNREKDIRALVVYGKSAEERVRSSVNLGQNIDTWNPDSMQRLRAVIQYLSVRSLESREIIASHRHKIVVKINPRS